MNNEKAMHADDVQLLRLSHGELPHRQAAALRTHLGVCRECQDRFSAVERTLELYGEYHNARKTLDPAPPRPWDDLKPGLHRLEASVVPARGGTYRTWLAIAAALIVCVLIVFRFQHAPKVSAGELLRKASGAAPQTNPAKRIRVRTGARTLVRPAVLLRTTEPENETRGLAALFAAAHYSWEDPLSARSFAAWRDQLGEKQDRVQTVRDSRNAAELYEIRTTTRSSALTEATLLLSAQDLRPVRETMRFEDEVVELLPADDILSPAPPALAQPLRPGAPSAPPAPAGPAQELQAIAALHGIGADLGEPVEVSRDGGALVVKGTGLTPQREEQIREAVSAVEGVTVRFDEPGSGHLSSGESRRVGVAAGPRTELQSRLGEEVVNRILDASEAVMARAFAMRALAKRFPPGVVAQFAEADRGVLAQIRGEHAAALATRLRDLESALGPALPASSPMAVPSPAGWQDGAGRIFTAAQSLDQLLTRMLAGGNDASGGLPELSTALKQLDAEVRAYSERER